MRCNNNGSGRATLLCACLYSKMSLNRAGTGPIISDPSGFVRRGQWRAYQKAALMISQKSRARDRGPAAREGLPPGIRVALFRGNARSHDAPARAGLAGGQGNWDLRGDGSRAPGGATSSAQSRDYARSDAINLPNDLLGGRFVGGAALACSATAYILSQLGGNAMPDATPQDKPTIEARTTLKC